jgi:hypothetical protein
MRSWSWLEIGAGVSLMLVTASVVVPAFVRNVHASRLAEPVEGLARIAAGASAFVTSARKMPDSAPQTPSAPPRAVLVVDPPDTWETPAWRALDFRATPEGVPHAFSFALDVRGYRAVARAHGDLDGDGITSTFELSGELHPDGLLAFDASMYIERELE